MRHGFISAFCANEGWRCAMILRGNCTLNVWNDGGEQHGLMIVMIERESISNAWRSAVFQPWAIIVGLRASSANVYWSLHMWFSCSGANMSRGARRIFAPPTLQQKDAIVSRRVVVYDKREFRKSALDSKLLPAFVLIETLTTVGTESPLKKKKPRRKALQDVFVKSSLSRYFGK